MSVYRIQTNLTKLSFDNSENCNFKYCSFTDALDQFTWGSEIIGLRILGYIDMSITVGNSSLCMAKCEKETKFPCLSIEYRLSDQWCRLSTAVIEIVEISAWAPSSSPDVIYAERTCA